MHAVEYVRKTIQNKYSDQWKLEKPTNMRMKKKADVNTSKLRLSQSSDSRMAVAYTAYYTCIALQQMLLLTRTNYHVFFFMETNTCGRII